MFRTGQDGRKYVSLVNQCKVTMQGSKYFEIIAIHSFQSIVIYAIGRHCKRCVVYRFITRMCILHIFTPRKVPVIETLPKVSTFQS